MSGCGTRIVLREQKPLALCDRCPCFGSLYPPLAALTFAAQSIICAFCLAACTSRSLHRHLELCGIALALFAYFPVRPVGGPARCQHPPGLQTRSPPADLRTPRSSACATVLIAGIGFRALALPPFFGQPCRISSASLVGDRPPAPPMVTPVPGPVCVCRSLPTNLKYTCPPVLREDIAAPPPFAAGFSGSGQFFAVFSGFRAVSLRCLPVFTGF